MPHLPKLCSNILSSKMMVLIFNLIFAISHFKSTFTWDITIGETFSTHWIQIILPLCYRLDHLYWFSLVCSLSWIIAQKSLYNQTNLTVSTIILQRNMVNSQYKYSQEHVKTNPAYQRIKTTTVHQTN